MDIDTLMIEALNRKFFALPHHARSRQVWLMLEGDGGQAYLTVPWHRLGRRPRIATALRFLNRLSWPHNQDERAFASLLPASACLPGGIGSGLLWLTPWFHPGFTALERSMVIEWLDIS
jgi:hypothetical protein